MEKVRQYNNKRKKNDVQIVMANSRRKWMQIQINEI